MPTCTHCAGENPPTFDSMDQLVDHLTDAHDVFTAVTRPADARVDGVDRGERIETDGGLEVNACDDCGRDLHVRDHSPSCPRRSVVCEGCGSYVQQRVTKQIDVSPPDEYYPEFIHVCPSCTVDDDQEVATDGGVTLPGWAERTEDGDVRCTNCDEVSEELPVDHLDVCLFSNDLVADGGRVVRSSDTYQMFQTKRTFDAERTNLQGFGQIARLRRGISGALLGISVLGHRYAPD